MVREQVERAADPAADAWRFRTTQRLFDSLLHDVRNPLNAISINLDVLTEKLKREQGEVPPTAEKNLRVMREQIGRVDGILKSFAEFLAPKAGYGAPTVDLSEIAVRALEILGHEIRRSQLKVRQAVEPKVRVSGGDLGLLNFLVLQALFEAITTARPEGELELKLHARQGRAVLQVRHAGLSANVTRGVPPAVSCVGRMLGAEVSGSGGELEVSLPLAAG